MAKPDSVKVKGVRVSGTTTAADLPLTPAKAGNGYQDIGVKTTGIKQRGHGAATKGFTSRGPMA